MLLDPSAQIRRRFREIAVQVAHAGRGEEHVERQSPWLSSQELAEYLRLTDRKRPREAALDWANRHRVVSVLVNRERRFARRDVEAVLAHALTVRRSVA